MITMVDGSLAVSGAKVTFCIDEETNDSRYHIEGTESFPPYDRVHVILRRTKLRREKDE